MAKIIFLDVDGVLNGHQILREAGCCGIDRKCIRQLNRVIRQTAARIVISSSWRYMVHGGSMSLEGMKYLFRTHGASGWSILGVTPPDEVVAGRGAQIDYWIKMQAAQKIIQVDRYVVLDDDKYEVGLNGKKFRHPLVLCDGSVGLTAADANKAIAILGEVNGTADHRSPGQKNAARRKV